MTVTDKDETLLDFKTCQLVKEYVPGRDKLMALSDFFSVLSDGTRIKILSALSISPMCVTDLSKVLELNQTTVSHQLKNLRNIGAVDYRRQGKISFYAIKNKQILDVMLSAVGFIG
ncbi:MAG: metalloregulator ArsR/SmtB family transcription factor [Clostridiales bacterium]|jgi:DNA-binding transcriptional ArsR family regulator|nr:metalloregulator ArsR/SmtB family transcription factor [Clostridiales bacterium]